MRKTLFLIMKFLSRFLNSFKQHNICLTESAALQLPRSEPSWRTKRERERERCAHAGESKTSCSRSSNVTGDSQKLNKVKKK